MNSIELTRKQAAAIAEAYSFTATNVEKVIKLCGILDDLNTIEFFNGKLALKGGTAINLVLIPGLPRLSVDLDLDLAIDCSKDEMLRYREQLDESLSAYCIEQGYALWKRESYSLCSYELLYNTVTGSRDKIKLDINYLSRCHVFEPMISSISHPFFKDTNFKVFHLQAVEILAARWGLFLKGQNREICMTCILFHSQA